MLTQTFHPSLSELEAETEREVEADMFLMSP